MYSHRIAKYENDLPISVQFFPEYPTGQEHKYDPSTGLVSQIAGDLQGFEEHASCKWQRSPVLPMIEKVCESHGFGHNIYSKKNLP